VLTKRKSSRHATGKIGRDGPMSGTSHRRTPEGARNGTERGRGQEGGGEYSVMDLLREDSSQRARKEEKGRGKKEAGHA